MTHLTITVYIGHQWGGKWGYHTVNYLLPLKATHVVPGRDWVDVRDEKMTNRHKQHVACGLRTLGGHYE